MTTRRAYVERGRKTWRVDHLDIVDEPLALSLLRYRMPEDRLPTEVDANVVSSHWDEDKHLPILDLDFDHLYVPSTTPGHAHLYLNVPIRRWRLFVLLWGLYVGGVIWGRNRGLVTHVEMSASRIALVYQNRTSENFSGSETLDVFAEERATK